MGWLLFILLVLSLLANVAQYHKWHTYRTRPSGSHSHTGMMPVIRPKG